jgi:hypothetical protein
MSEITDEEAMELWNWVRVQLVEMTDDLVGDGLLLEVTEDKTRRLDAWVRSKAGCAGREQDR